MKKEEFLRFPHDRGSKTKGEEFLGFTHTHRFPILQASLARSKEGRYESDMGNNLSLIFQNLDCESLDLVGRVSQIYIHTSLPCSSSVLNRDICSCEVLLNLPLGFLDLQTSFHRPGMMIEGPRTGELPYQGLLPCKHQLIGMSYAASTDVEKQPRLRHK
ncbi:hypothetical protein VNO77_03394 [Canavalia gladiata]|uniref:Uncharacterized protein n=1 Tax=Canavalia gladiata TaxID=3824 RepID=A0AAN9MZT1_CANGL